MSLELLKLLSKNHATKIILNRYKNGRVSKDKVHQLFILLGISKPDTVFKTKTISRELLTLIGDQGTVIIK